MQTHSHWQLAASLMELEHRKPQERDHQQQQQCSNNREVVSSASEQCRSPMIRLQLVSEWVNEHVWSTDCQLKEKVWSNERAKSRESAKEEKLILQLQLRPLSLSVSNVEGKWTPRVNFYVCQWQVLQDNGRRRKNGGEHEKNCTVPTTPDQFDYSISRWRNNRKKK